MVRVTGHYLKNILTAQAHCYAILEHSLTDEAENIKPDQVNLYGDDVRMVREHKLNLKLLTPAEKDEAVTQYESGLTMTAVANLYGCHYTTVGRILRERGVEIRD